jgi:hypothetical protein
MRYFNIISIIILTLTIISCEDLKKEDKKKQLLPQIFQITENEKIGMQEAVNFYGGHCEYSIGTTISTEEGKKQYFELELSNSNVIEKKPDNAKMAASNIAYLFYKNLNGEERQNYDEIHVILIFDNEKKREFVYPQQQLELVTKRMQMAYSITELIKEKKFEVIKTFMNDKDFISYDKNILISSLKSADPQFGNVTEGFRPFGFRIYKTNDGREILHISGAIIRDKQNNEFSIDLDLNGADESIYMLDYKF